MSLAREHHQGGYEAPALRLLGEIAARRDDPEQAEGHYGHALAFAEKIDARPLAAHCHLGLGKLYRRTRRRKQALQHLTTAMTMYRELDMPFWLEQGEAEVREPQ